MARKRPLSQLRIAVLGATRAGLPLALLLADKGHHVVLVEKDAKALAALRAGRYPYLEPGGAELLLSCADSLRFSSEMSAVKGCQLIILMVSTSVDRRLLPETTALDTAVAELRGTLHGGETVVLRASVFPGTCQRLQEMLPQVSLAFCPERLASGHVLKELQTVPQLVAGSDEARRVVSQAFDFVELIEMELVEAEVATLFLNAWRYVSFGTANQFFHIAVSKGLDFQKIRAAICYRYERADGFPNSGFTAGPRLYQDMMQLAAYCNSFSLGNAAMLVNETMPDSLLEHAKQKLKMSLKGLRCGILGMAFKAGSDDAADSLAFKLRSLLLREGANVSCSDAHISAADFVSQEALLKNLG